MAEIMGKSAMSRRETGRGAVVFTAAGLTAAFGLASCCALPLLLYTFGFGTAWLSRIGIISLQYRPYLIAVAAVGLGAGAVLMWRQWKSDTCARDSLCAHPLIQSLTIAGLLLGSVLLYYGYTLV